ncbi:MAG: phosphoketolase family protein [Solirubrobacteraceae bacterium]|nr:phosphoketolase family protein [Solirubrobacteraceae bacterium]
MPESTASVATLDRAELATLHAWWRAANYLSAGQIYLQSNPLLRRPLQATDVKPRPLGHWGTSPGLNLIWAHMNRLIRREHVHALFVTGPGHGGPAIVANTYLEGTYSEVYPHVAQDERGLQRLCRQFSFPGGIPSHVSPETPGSIHEGGELGYSLVHAFGAAFDNPDLLVCCVVGDGEAETGPLAASWHSGKFLDPVRDGAVLPVLHLNGYKIANPTVLARIPEEELRSLMEGYGYAPLFVSGSDPEAVHEQLATAIDAAYAAIREIQRRARAQARRGLVAVEHPAWPMIVLRTPKGWTGPAVVDGLQVEGTFRSHQLPLKHARKDPVQLDQLREWLQSYRPHELFDEAGVLRPEIAALTPPAHLRMSASPHANGGLILRDLTLPDIRSHAVAVPEPGRHASEPTAVLGGWLADVMAANGDRFRVMGPDETASNRLGAVIDLVGRTWEAELEPGDDRLSRHGRVMEILSEHLCEGWLEGYLLTGRHGLLNSYEAFIHIVDSMVGQHAKWLKVAGDIPWRLPLASLNILLSSHVWRQDHNGFSHQDPGFIDFMVNKKPTVTRVYLPPDANCLLAVGAHCLHSRDHVNVIIAGKQPTLDLLTIAEAEAHCARGAGVWRWAGTAWPGERPDVVLACAGDVPTLETLAAADLLRHRHHGLRVQVVNVVDLMRLQPPGEHPNALSTEVFHELFPQSVPVVFAFHGYPHLIHRLLHGRGDTERFHVHGYHEEGTTTTPFDMAMLNDLDRFQLAIDAAQRTGGDPAKVDAFVTRMLAERERARTYTREFGEDAPDIARWTWPSTSKAGR